MNTFEILLSVALLWGVAVVTPGPNLLITIRTAMSHSSLKSLALVLGIVFGTLIWALAGFLGISFLFQALPWLYVPLKITGGLYLIYLGVTLIRNANEKELENGNGFKKGVLRSFYLGAFTNLSNPKTAFFITSLFALTIPHQVSYSVGMISVVLMCLISFLWYGMMAYLFSQNFFKIRYMHFKKWLERISGGVFIGFGGTLAVSD